MDLKFVACDFFEYGDQLQQRYPRSVRQVHGLRVHHATTNGIGED
jgi:hypothetical protein